MVWLRYQIRKGVLQMSTLIKRDTIDETLFDNHKEVIDSINEHYTNLSTTLDDVYLPFITKAQESVGTSIHQTQANLDNAEFDFVDENNLNINDQVIQNYLSEARQRFHETIADTMDIRVVEQHGYGYAVPMYLNDITAMDLINSQYSWETFMAIAAAADGADDNALMFDEWAYDREALDITLLEKLEQPEDEEDLIQFNYYIEELANDVEDNLEDVIRDIGNLQITINNTPDLEREYADVLAQSFDALNEQ